MADLTGIENAGEFFSAHYLQERLPEEIKSQDAATQAVLEQRVTGLRGTGAHLFRTLAELAGKAAAGRAEVAHDLAVRSLEALGYERSAGYAVLEHADTAKQAVPLLAELRQGDQPYLYVIEAGLPYEDDAILEQPVATLAALPEEATHAGLSLPPALTVDETVGALFAGRAPPRWVVILGGREAILAERGRWGRGQFLRFDLETLLRRRDAGALRVTAALLSRELLAPGAGRALPDALMESSHQHAVGVTADLKFAAREAVELLGNEYVHYQRTTSKKALYDDRAARELTEDCLVYLFRLLFLFYAEARAGELQGLPMGAEEYARGYSLEVLRELEQVPLTTPEARDGFFCEFYDRAAGMNRTLVVPKGERDAFQQAIGTVHKAATESRVDFADPVFAAAAARKAYAQSFSEESRLSEEDFVNVVGEALARTDAPAEAPRFTAVKVPEILDSFQRPLPRALAQIERYAGFGDLIDAMNA